MSLRVLYAGSPEASAKTLELLYEKQADYGYEIVGVLSNPPSTQGRHSTLIPTPVAQFATDKGLPVFTPDHLDAACRQVIQPLEADLLVCFAYGHIFGPKFLEMFKYGGINLHPSMLPKYRGCTPVNAAILNRDEQTAVSIQTLSLKMDEGDILAQEVVSLDGTETAESLLNTSAEIGAELLCIVMAQTAEFNALPDGQKQTGEPSYTGIIKKEDGKINWNDSASLIEAKIRAYYPEPGCWCLEGNNQTLRILSAKYISAEDEKAKPFEQESAGKVLTFVKPEGIYIKTGNGILCVTQLQRQGKKVMMYKDFMNGARDFIGSVLQ